MSAQIVIIGGGFGGLAAARALKGADARIILIDRNNHHLFQPLLYQVATASLSPADIATPIRSILKDQVTTDVVMAEVLGIDPQKQLVLTNIRPFNYDYLIIATGSQDHYFSHPEWQLLAPGLKSINDATQIRQRILKSFESAEIEPDRDQKQRLLTFVIVGAGPTGVEMAGAISELARLALVSDFHHIDPNLTKTVLIEAGPRILAGFNAALAERAQQKLIKLGVEIYTQSRVEQIDSSRVRFSGKEITTQNVIWCAGVVASPVSKWLGIQTDRTGRVPVRSDLSVPGFSNIWVIGDAAAVTQDERLLPGIAPVAMQEGRYVASVIRQKLKAKPSPGPFRYKNKGNLATVGRSFAIAEIGKFRLSGWFAWITWIVVHIYYLIGFRNRILVLIQWAWAYFTFQRGARLITSNAANTTLEKRQPDR